LPDGAKPGTRCRVIHTFLNRNFSGIYGHNLMFTWSFDSSARLRNIPRASCTVCFFHHAQNHLRGFTRDKEQCCGQQDGFRYGTPNRLRPSQPGEKVVRGLVEFSTSCSQRFSGGSAEAGAA
jgi:hypothetical protein